MALSAALLRRSPVARAGGRLSWRPNIELLALLGYGLLLAAFFVLRSGGHWADGDSARQALAVRSMLDSGQLNDPNGDVYTNGFGYTALAAFIAQFSGVSVATLQQLVFPLVSALLVVPAFALYQELTGSRKAATLATVLLFFQPEFLFVILRGSHERMLRALMLTAFWLLVRSARLRDKPRQLAIHVALFYLTTFGIIATNALFGISFATAIAAAMALAWLTGRHRPGLLSLAGGAAGRLAWVAATVSAIGFLFMFWLYPPASKSLQLLHDLGSRVGALFLTTHTSTASNPYAAVVGGWVDLRVYAAVSISDYLLMLLSGVVWAAIGFRWLIRRERPRTAAVWWLWLLYGAFAFQGAFSMLVDRGGLLGNLEQRSFPSFAMVATPLLALALVRLRLGPALRIAAGLGLAAMAGLAILKATNEPSVSNKWTFYTPFELQAMDFADAHNYSQLTWSGPDERLSSAFLLVRGNATDYNDWDQYVPKPPVRTFLLSDVMRMQSSRLEQPLPPLAQADQVYDDGAAQLYHLRPESPFEH
ncbi:MAG TPA: hypothetical protein VFS62_07430 [Chloroflexota bacterium]|nr:hypothetical protein [Chloroflexota bacterium]